MKTKIIKIDKDNINSDLIIDAVNIIKNSGLVAFPTETVYGLGANGFDENAAKKIFAAKGRPEDNPLILHVYSVEQVEELVEEIPDIAKKCMEEFWPGPLTILLPKSDKVPNIITAGLDTVAIRMPENKIALELIKMSNVPIAAPSANISGRPSPTSAKHVIDDLMDKVDMIVDGGETGVGLESTVLDLSGDLPMILRPGGVTKEDLQKIIPNVTIDFAIIKEDANIIPKSPGQKYRHYAPKSEMLVFSGDIDKITDAIMAKTKEYMAIGKRVGVICTDETKEIYKDGLIISMGSRRNNETIARNLFNTLRLFDEENVDIILAEGVEPSHLGIAIMNRMMKAAGGRIIKV
ncbi:threonylcarbamoyl-AMP synthase [Tissierella sp. P1]|uniref:L-threonylcarbamoyladenylate synthase n=1 Tax=Tissierella TaxID=41273 RepID=UPI000B9FFF17|nr:L-threonylcarbamoyladenylate synthase [Tissierella sp. P1]MDU5079813.1 L-threonylcarbamoyladenylate synthase [Bacillota bacterium]OZV13400.1 threonylcarbamoyl-AMP synthase [Tissierella sp. P1]